MSTIVERLDVIVEKWKGRGYTVEALADCGQLESLDDVQEPCVLDEDKDG